MKVNSKRQAVMDMDSSEYIDSFKNQYVKHCYGVEPSRDEIIQYKNRGVSPEKAADKFYDKVYGREFRRVTNMAEKDLANSNKQTFEAKIRFMATSTTPLPSKTLSRKDVVAAFELAKTPKHLRP